MRFEIPVSPHTGSTRRRRKFLWFPKVIGSVGRWLEFATWEESYSISYGDSTWMPTRWLDLMPDLLVGEMCD